MLLYLQTFNVVQVDIVGQPYLAENDYRPFTLQPSFRVSCEVLIRMMILPGATAVQVKKLGIEVIG